VEGWTEVLARHRRALDVPTGETFAPRAVPTQNVFGFSFLPQREIFGIALLAVHFDARPGCLRLDAPVRQLAVLRGARHVEIDVAVGNIGVSLADQFLDHLDLFGNVTAGARRNVRADDAERV